jgi:hypothetical protein
LTFSRDDSRASDTSLQEWLASLDERYLADLTPAEVARALRALSSCYVERREKLASGAALDSAGKRAAFALFYSPLHFLLTREVVRSLPGAAVAFESLLDLGCGTGAAGAAWALEGTFARITGADRNGWAVDEANRTYRIFGLRGRAMRVDLARVSIPAAARNAILAAYTINEVTDRLRGTLLPRLLEARARGVRVLVVEPIARGTARWWDAWATEVTSAGGRVDEWRFPVALPERQRRLAKAAGLDPRELTARTLWM